MIEISGLGFSYPGGDFSLSLPEFKVPEGERLALIGPSGSGKTTLLNIIAGIYLCGRGRVRVDGMQLGSLSEAARRSFRLNRIGFVFQDFELLGYLSVRDNILHPFRIGAGQGLGPEALERLHELAQSMGIADKLKKRPAKLSQGEKQRAAICRALITAPRLILADEATGNLDPANKERILDLLFSHLDKSGATLVAVTHDHQLLPRFSRVLDFMDFSRSAE